MGVKNLWRLLLPIGHRVSIETLSHQTLAIDASIWLTQISKACRDPDTGRALPNKPHVRIFLLRLMKLLYHQIKPVVVFDGVMPAVKRREIQRRRARRERLWRDDDDDDDADNNEGGERGGGGGGATSALAGGGALKRAAKKILVKQLKEWREREVIMMHRKRRKKNESGDEDNDEEPDDDASSGGGTKKIAGTTSNDGALAAGFTLDNEIIGETDKATSQLQRSIRDSTNKSIHDSKADFVTINSDDDDDDDEEEAVVEVERIHDANQSSNGTTRHEHEFSHDNEYESENDWEMSRAVQMSMNDSIQYHHHQQQQQQQQRRSSTTALASTTSNRGANTPFENSDYYHDNDNIETIASLPSESRYQWIDSQWKAHRIQSRRECIQAAANPEDYSNTQLRNFYKSNALAKRVGEISKLVETKKEDYEDDKDDSDGGSSVHRSRPALLRLRRSNHDTSTTDDDDDDNEMFVSSSNTAGASMKVLFGEDDSDEHNEIVDADGEDCGGGGGFLLPSAAADDRAKDRIRTKVDMELLDDDSGSDNRSRNSDGGARSPSDMHTSLDQKFTANEHRTTVVHCRPSKNDHTNRLAKLHELSTADQEWAEWGGEVVDETGVDSTKKAEVLDSTESESDEDALDGSFLMVGHANNPLQLSKRTKNAVKIASVALPVANALDNENEEEDDVDWEDGDSEVGVEESSNSGGLPPSLHEANTTCDDNPAKSSTQHSINDHSSPDIGAIEIPSDDDSEERRHAHATSDQPKPSVIANETLTINIFDESASVYEFNADHADDPQAAALQRAQATAANLTSWAGRAFQRAISSLATHEPQPDSSGRTIERESIEVAAIGLATDYGRAFAEDVPVDQSATGPSQDESNSSRAGNLIVQRTPVFIDTSLQGLTDAHNALLEEEKAMERDMSTITDEMKADILELLQLCGIPWIESPSEAEAQCAALEELGLVDGVVTEDSDIFVFGGRKVYKNFFNEQKYVEAYFAKDIERDLALKKHQLVALAMLLGGDYTDGVKGVGIVNGMEILQAFTIHDSEEGIRVGLQKFREWLDSFGDPALADDDDASHREYLFHKKHKSARTRWVAPADFPSLGILNAYLKPVVDKSQAKFTWATPDLQGLQSYCAETIGWEMAETERVVNPVVKVLESGSKQTRIESYFMKYDDGIKFARVRSKRLKAVLTDIQRGDDENAIEGNEENEFTEQVEQKNKRQKKSNDPSLR